MHHTVHAHHLHDGGHHHVKKASHHDAAGGVLELFSRIHGGIDAGIHGSHGSKAAQEGEGRTQESRDLHLGANVEEQRAKAGKEQGGLDIQGQSVSLDQNGHQHRCAEHGEHMLQAQDQHLGQAQFPGVPNGSDVIGFHVFSLSFFIHVLICDSPMTFTPERRSIPAATPSPGVRVRVKVPS